MTRKFDTLPVIAERGSLVLRGTPGTELFVGFADWYDHSGFSELQLARSRHEIYSGAAHQAIRLNGSQAQTVKAWAEEYA